MSELPSYICRHLELGFDDEDITALLSAIDSSRSDYGEPALPSLPAEVLFMVLEHIPVDHILGFRLVCSSFQKFIDTRVFSCYARRMKLLGCMTDAEHRFPHTFPRYDAKERLRWIEATFSHFENADGSRNRKVGEWLHSHAVFQLDPGWFEAFACAVAASQAAAQSFAMTGAPTSASYFLEGLEGRTPGSFNDLGWLISIDKCVLDVELSRQKPGRRPAMLLDQNKLLVTLEWKPVLFNFLKSEDTLRRLLETAREAPVFTFGLFEDCLREVRRRRFGQALDMSDRNDRKYAWSLRLLRPLFGKGSFRALEQVDPIFTYYRLSDIEDQAIKWIRVQRRAASRSEKEVEYLKQLALDRNTMISELQSLNELFGTWKSNMYDAVAEPSSHRRVLSKDTSTRPFIELPINPLFWSDGTIAREAQRVQRWQSQKIMRTAMVQLLRESHEALNIPEDAFDLLGSDF